MANFRLILVLLTCLIALPASAQRLSGQLGNPVTKTFQLRAMIEEEGSYQLQKSAGISSNWTVITNFDSLPALARLQDTMSGKQRIYRLVRNTVPVIITNQPSGTTNYFNQEVRLEAAATGSWPIRYQWFKDGVAVAGATSNKLVFNGRTPLSGTYTLLVSNLWSMAVTTPARVKTINPVASTVAGKKINFEIDATQGGGSYQSTFDPSGFFTTVSTNILYNDSGYWQYAARSENNGQIFLPGSITYPNGLINMEFTTTTNGVYTLTVPGWQGFQKGKFTFLN